MMLLSHSFFENKYFISSLIFMIDGNEKIRSKWGRGGIF